MERKQVEEGEVREELLEGWKVEKGKMERKQVEEGQVRESRWRKGKWREEGSEGGGRAGGGEKIEGSIGGGNVSGGGGGGGEGRWSGSESSAPHMKPRITTHATRFGLLYFSDHLLIFLLIFLFSFYWNSILANWTCISFFYCSFFFFLVTQHWIFFVCV